jgi:O-acetylserine/cysteine efflux transporter
LVAPREACFLVARREGLSLYSRRLSGDDPGTRSVPLKDILLTLLVVFIWGTSFVAIKFGVEEIPPILLTALRFFFSAIPAVFLVPRPKVALWILLAFGFVLGVVKFSLLFIAIKLGMPIGLTSIVVQMQVFFTILLAFAFYGEQPTRLQLIGAGVAFIGIVIFGYARAQAAPLLPFMMVLGAAFFWGLANVIGKKAGRVDMLAFVVWASLVAPLPLLALSLMLEGPGAVVSALTHPSLKGALSVAFIAYIATVLGFGAWNNLLSRHPVGQVAPFALLIPVVGMACGALFFGEVLTLPILIGSGVVFAGLLINVFGDRLVRRLRA